MPCAWTAPLPTLRFGEFRKFLHHSLIDLALERDDERRQPLQALPAPRAELRLVAARAIHIDLAVIADETHREPFLGLPAISALPGLTHDIARNVVAEPVRDLGKLLDRVDIGLLVQLAQRSRPRVLARIDAALRQLPDMRVVDVLGPAQSLADEDAARAVEHHDADAGPIGEGLEAGHGSDNRLGIEEGQIADVRYQTTDPPV